MGGSRALGMWLTKLILVISLKCTVELEDNTTVQRMKHILSLTTYPYGIQIKILIFKYLKLMDIISV